MKYAKITAGASERAIKKLLTFYTAIDVTLFLIMDIKQCELKQNKSYIGEGSLLSKLCAINFFMYIKDFVVVTSNLYIGFVPNMSCNPSIIKYLFMKIISFFYPILSIQRCILQSTISTDKVSRSIAFVQLTA